MKIFRNFRKFLVGPALLALLFVPFENAMAVEKLRFAIIPKNLSPFFYQVQIGCVDMARKLGNVECIFDGSKDTNFRMQDDFVSRLLDQGIDGIAISVIHSKFLAEHSLKKAREMGVPVITFDSDLIEDDLKQTLSLRQAYVGTDNVALGREIGRALLAHAPAGGFYSIVSGNRTAPNMAQRLQGLRAVLEGSPWQESIRSPYYVEDEAKWALRVVSYTLNLFHSKQSEVTAIVSLGGWPQQIPEQYRKQITPYRADLVDRNFSIIISDALTSQLELLGEGLASANIGQYPYGMGAMAIEILNDLHDGKTVPEMNFTGVKICLPNRKPMCRMD